VDGGSLLAGLKQCCREYVARAWPPVSRETARAEMVAVGLERHSIGRNERGCSHSATLSVRLRGCRRRPIWGRFCSESPLMSCAGPASSSLRLPWSQPSTALSKDLLSMFHVSSRLPSGARSGLRRRGSSPPRRPPRRYRTREDHEDAIRLQIFCGVEPRVPGIPLPGAWIAIWKISCRQCWRCTKTVGTAHTVSQRKRRSGAVNRRRFG
jgi:hypothetical protein